MASSTLLQTIKASKNSQNVRTYIHDCAAKLDTKELIYIFTLITFIVITTTRYIHRRKPRNDSSRPSTPTKDLSTEKVGSATATNPARTPGKWLPSLFTMPTPPPYPNWSITETAPLPYRPFRHGPKYFITMGLRNEAHENWIELDNHYPAYHAKKAARIAERGDKCCRTAPEAMPAALEFLDELVPYLCARYPSLYRRTAGGLENLWSGESFDVAERVRGGEDPMVIASRLVQDDLAIMIERADGQYYLLAGGILLPGFWRLEDKFGMPLSEIHTSGDVPGFKDKLERGMMNFFRRLKPEEMVARNNYFIQVDDDLAWSWSIGSEDAKEVSGWSAAEKDRAVEMHYFRSERQTLRRLPKSGGVVFTIRTYFLPVTEIVKEDYVPGRLASAVRSWSEDVGRYKGDEKYRKVLLEYLDRMHQEQVDRGLDLEKEDEARAYPY